MPTKQNGPKGCREINSARPVRIVKPALVEPQFPMVEFGDRRSNILATTSHERSCRQPDASGACQGRLYPDVNPEFAAAESKFALNGLLTGIDQSYLQANVVQITNEVGKDFPAELNAVLQAAHPTQLVITVPKTDDK